MIKKIYLLDWDNSTKKIKKNHDTQFPNTLILKNKLSCWKVKLKKNIKLKNDKKINRVNLSNLKHGSWDWDNPMERK